MPQGQDLLTGSVPKKLIRFAFPLFLANLLQALYNVVDMLVVGKIVGKTGLAAISNAFMLCFIINSLCIGLTMGGSVLVAQCKGSAGHDRNAVLSIAGGFRCCYHPRPRHL